MTMAKHPTSSPHQCQKEYRPGGGNSESTEKLKTYKNTTSEGAALQQSAILQLDYARNLKGASKTAVVAALKRLCVY